MSALAAKTTIQYSVRTSNQILIKLDWCEHHGGTTCVSSIVDFVTDRL